MKKCFLNAEKCALAKQKAKKKKGLKSNEKKELKRKFAYNKKIKKRKIA